MHPRIGYGNHSHMAVDLFDEAHEAWRAKCEALAAEHLSAIDLRDVVQVDTLEEQDAVVEDGRAVPAA